MSFSYRNPRGFCTVQQQRSVVAFESIFNIYKGMIMKQFIVSVLLAIALLTSGMVVTQYSMVGTAYADGGGGSD